MVALPVKLGTNGLHEPQESGFAQQPPAVAQELFQPVS